MPSVTLIPSEKWTEGNDSLLQSVSFRLQRGWRIPVTDSPEGARVDKMEGNRCNQRWEQKPEITGTYHEV